MADKRAYTIENLMDAIGKSGKVMDTEKILEAYRVAAEAHKDQKRSSGEPYIIHPIAVATILVELGMDSEAIIAALLHDVVEDTEMSLDELKKRFGQEVAFLVDGVTKLGKIPYSSREEQQAENVRKMLLAMAQDVRVIIIKLADRLHNMRTLEYRSEQKQRDTSLETMEVYAPLAHRLGIRAVKEELEDLSMRCLDKVAYEEIEHQLSLKKEERDSYIRSIIERIRKRLEGEFPHIHIAGRVKSVFGIYRKIYMQGKSFEEIYDIYAVRVIVDSILDCYNILGIMHDMFRPIPNRFKDYISTPKPNMYQSLHTTVLDKEGIPFEIQIRTWDMHYTAEYGIAAHWKYKAGITGKDKLEERLAWIRRFLETQQESEDVEDIVRSIKSDIAPEEVFVFTPKGDVINLPTGATVIDFAYAIHSAVGNRMVGAKVDGRMVSIDYVVKTGNIVEILTTNAKGHGPSRDWLNIVKTSEARNKIRTWFKKERREENILEGREELEREFKRNNIDLSDADLKQFLLDIAKRQHFNSTDELFAAIGYGGISLSRIMPRIKEDYILSYKTSESAKVDRVVEATKAASKEKKVKGGVIVEGVDGCLVKFARCCNPLPGDEIIGFITRGFGVSIHKKDCINVLNSRAENLQTDRWVNCHWEGSVRETFKSALEIYAIDRNSLLADVSICLSNMHLAIHSLMAREAKDKHVIIQITVSVNDLDQLKFLIGTLKKIQGVMSVERSNQ